MDFFKQYQVQIHPYLLNNTQTNEAKRSVALLPAFSEIVRREQQNTLSLVEIGTSAGFLLNIDQYHYSLNGFLLGNPKITTSFITQWHGKLPENLQHDFLTLEPKIGIDINPLNIEDDNVKLWLKALIWPEQIERLKKFEFACQVLKNNKNNLVIMKGTLADHFDKISALCANSRILCFLSVWVLYQLSLPEKNNINEQLSALAKLNKQKIYFILDD